MLYLEVQKQFAWPKIIIFEQETTIVSPRTIEIAFKKLFLY